MAHPHLPTSSDSSKSCSRNCTNYTRVGIAAVLAYLIFLVATGEIIEIGRLGNNVGSSSSGVGGSDIVMKDSRIDCSTSVTAAIVQTPSNSNTPTKQRIYNPSYNYPAKHNEWDKQYGKVKSIVLLGERHSGTNWITDHLEECFGGDIKVGESRCCFLYWFGIVLCLYRHWSFKEWPTHGKPVSQYSNNASFSFSLFAKVTTEYRRFKHWFQEEDPERVPSKSAVVVSMYRDPYGTLSLLCFRRA